MRAKFFSQAERVSAYAEGKRAFEEGKLRGHNPYTTSKDLAGLWWYGWDRAEVKTKRKDLHLTTTS